MKTYCTKSQVYNHKKPRLNYTFKATLYHIAARRDLLEWKFGGFGVYGEHYFNMQETPIGLCSQK